jgi:DNA-binding NarL/FixJ family response regulator
MFKDHSDSSQRTGGSTPPVVKLSPAEAAVVAQVSRGLTNREIARELGKSPATVKNQLVSVYRKLGVRSRIRLMVLFRP